MPTMFISNVGPRRAAPPAGTPYAYAAAPDGAEVVERGELIRTITGHPNNGLTVDYLMTCSTDFLRGVAALAGGPVASPGQMLELPAMERVNPLDPPTSFAGAEGSFGAVTDDADPYGHAAGGQFLPMPTMPRVNPLLDRRVNPRLGLQ